jgi:preprotein translocase subunit SecA
MLTRTIENAQKKVEQQNFLIRKRVLEYDDVMNEQRRVIYKYRREILEGRDMSDVSEQELTDVVVRTVETYTPGEIFEDWDLAGLQAHAATLWPLQVSLSELEPQTSNRQAHRGRACRLRPARGGVRVGADALPGATDPAPDHRQPLARAPL